MFKAKREIVASSSSFEPFVVILCLTALSQSRCWSANRLSQSRIVKPCAS